MIRCPLCDGKTAVTEVRRVGKNSDRRRRRCVRCEHRFSTVEIVTDPAHTQRILCIKLTSQEPTGKDEHDEDT